MRRKVDEMTRIKEVVRAITKNKFKKVLCKKCGIKKNLEFHHFVYRLPIEEKDFTVLCKKCHGELHNYLT